jgi:outer membrane protein assembly factor BamB
VRGTEFFVDAKKEDNSVSFAVKEGTVAVLPVEVADRIEVMKTELKTETARDILEEITAVEIFVTEEKEITIEDGEVRKAVQEFDSVSGVIEDRIKKIDKKAQLYQEKEKEVSAKGEAAKDRDLREVREIREEITALKNDVAAVAGGKTQSMREILKAPVAVSEPAARQLEKIDKMETKEFLIAALIEPKEETEESKPAYTKLSLTVEPGDARIFVNGEAVGKGSFSGLYPPGTRIDIRVEREGFIPVEKNITVSGQPMQAVRIELRNSPLVWSLRTGAAPLTRKIATAQQRIIAADANGMLICADTGGGLLWSYQSANRPNNNSMPVVLRDTVIFSGARELVSIDMGTGREKSRLQLGTGDFSSHLFGRRVAVFNGNVIFPSNNALIVLEPSTLKELRRIPLPVNANSSPAVHAVGILIVDQKGELLVIDPASGEITRKISTGALQPVSIAPTIVGNYAVFSGRDGTVACVDLSIYEKKWEKKFDLGGGSGVYQDITASESAVYPYTGTQFYALELATGVELFAPVLSSCPPLFHDGTLYFGDPKGKLLLTDSRTGRLLKTYTLDSPVSAQPAVIMEDLLLATQSGFLYRLRPEYL